MAQLNQRTFEETRLVGVRLSDPFGYDDLGRVVTKNTGTNVCTSDPVNCSTLNGTICFAYDAATNLTGFTDNLGTTSYSYDAANNVSSLVEPGGTSGCYMGHTTTLCTAFASNANGQRTGTQYPGGATVSVTYDNAGNATSVVAKNNGASTTLSSFQYYYKDLVSGACPSSGTVIDRAKVTQAIKGPDSIVNPATTHGLQLRRLG